MIRHQRRGHGQAQLRQKAASGLLVLRQALADIMQQPPGAGQLGIRPDPGPAPLHPALTQSLGQGSRHGAHGAGMAQAALRNAAQAQQIPGFGGPQRLPRGGQPPQTGVILGPVHIFQNKGIRHRHRPPGEPGQSSPQAALAPPLRMGQDMFPARGGQQRRMAFLALIGGNQYGR